MVCTQQNWCCYLYPSLSLSLKSIHWYSIPVNGATGGASVSMLSIMNADIWPRHYSKHLFYRNIQQGFVMRGVGDVGWKSHLKTPEIFCRLEKIQSNLNSLPRNLENDALIVFCKKPICESWVTYSSKVFSHSVKVVCKGYEQHGLTISLWSRL